MITDYQFSIEAGRVDRFEQKLQQMLCQGGYCLLVSIGHRTGLFEVLSQLECGTSQEIAAAAGLQEGYVGDWLAAMSEGGFVEYDEMFKTYRLPSEQAVLLTQSAGWKNYVTCLQWFTLFGKLEDEIVECFREGQGISQSVRAALQSQLTAENRETEINGLFKYVLPLVPSLIMRLCEGEQVLDVGCGTGVKLLELAQTFPQSQFVGYDPCADSIEQASRAAMERGLENVSFFARELDQIHAIDAFDLIFAFDVMYDQTEPERVLSEIHAALRPGGLFLMQDLAGLQNPAGQQQKPLAPLLVTISYLRRMVQQQDPLSGFHCWGDLPAEDVLEETGFASVAGHTLPHDLLNVYYVATKSERN